MTSSPTSGPTCASTSACWPSCGNDHLVDVVRDLRRRSRLYGLTALAGQGRLEASAEEHLEILDALLARDEEAVRTVMTRHLGHVRGLWAAP